jgi:CheY-like chemotaxis protein
VKAARWRANTFSYSRQDACSPRRRASRQGRSQFLYQSIIVLRSRARYSSGYMAIEEKRRVIAIVDDDELIRGALHGLMKAAGFLALVFASAEEFLNSGEQEHTACLIADIRMPGMSGLELQSELKKDHHCIPIIFITAHGDEKLRMQALRSGAVEFLTKPFNHHALLDSVRIALDT